MPNKSKKLFESFTTWKRDAYQPDVYWRKQEEHL